MNIVNALHCDLRPGGISVTYACPSLGVHIISTPMPLATNLQAPVRNPATASPCCQPLACTAQATTKVSSKGLDPLTYCVAMHSHRFQDPPYKCVDLPSASGVGVCLQPISHGPGELSSGETFEGHPAGFIIGHDTADPAYGGARCDGGLTLDDAHWPHKWDQTGSLEGGDLTLTPSVLCTDHPSFHAYITNGRWTG